MGATRWGKFYWSDWSSDHSLRLCGLAAQGLWMRLLCVAAEADPTGYLVINGRPLGVTDIALLAGVTETEVETLINELERNGVFFRTRNGTIYSRRMVRDAKRSKIAEENGKKGGIANIRKIRENQVLLKPPLNPDLKPPLKPPIPEARIQRPESSHGLESKAARASPLGQAGPGENDQGKTHPVGDDPFAAACRNAVAAVNPSEPVLIALDIEVLRSRLPDGWTMPDLHAGITAAMTKSGRKYRSWESFAGWVRGAMQDRMASAPSGRTALAADRSPTHDSEPRMVFPGGVSWPVSSVIDAVKRQQIDKSDWPESALGPPPGELGCRIPPEIITEARTPSQ